MYRNRTKGYHLDYAFVPESFIPYSSLAIGHPDDWLLLSDYMPLTLEFDDSNLRRLPEYDAGF